ncbi:MAG: 30S ribosomal protein S6 [Chloroflexi bacterium RBG_13_54_9]|nr:MAG: 30S ribosomal protein S6 [Chloroflexi bacterium RBG_13_54_9]
MRDYELVMIVSPEIADEDVPAAIERVSQFITGRGGTVVEVDQWGRRRLAYPIRHFNEGIYVLTQFRLEPRLAAELEANLQISEEILRHLLVRSGKEDDSDP